MSKAKKHADVVAESDTSGDTPITELPPEISAAYDAAVTAAPDPKCDVCPEPAVAEYRVACGDTFYRCETHAAVVGFNAAQATTVRRLGGAGDEHKPCG